MHTRRALSGEDTAAGSLREGGGVGSVFARYAGFVAVWMVLVALAPPASAHAELVRTSPADGQRLDTPPRAVVLEFTEQVQPVVTRLWTPTDDR